MEEIREEVRQIVLDTKLAQNELGWGPKYDIKTGLKETYEWFNNVITK